MPDNQVMGTSTSRLSTSREHQCVPPLHLTLVVYNLVEKYHLLATLSVDIFKKMNLKSCQSLFNIYFGRIRDLVRKLLKTMVV